MKGILFDMDGVLYEGNTVVTGAVDAISWCIKQQIPHLFLTNTTSRPRSALVNKLAGMGIRADLSKILTPPVAAVRWLQEHTDGPVALFVPDNTQEEFSDITIADPDYSGPLAAVVIGDLGMECTFDTLNQAFRLLMTEPRPQLIALGMTRYWRAEDGLRLDTGPFVKALEYAAGQEALVLGKPAVPFFEAALSLIDQPASEVCMIGDDIRTDVEGAQQAGLEAVLVRTGKFRPGDLETGIKPQGILDSISDLPQWWSSSQH